MIEARRLHRLRALLLLLATLCGMTGAAHAQPVAQADAAGNNIRLELVADGQPRPGSTWTLALHFTPRTHEWHGYWANPGDAGEPMRLVWTLPPGWTAEKPLYPVPKLLKIAGLANHVFEGPYTVLVLIKVPAGADTARAPPIALEADYLACTDKICVPERAKVSLDPRLARHDPRFDKWRAAIAPMLDQTGRFTIAGNTVRIAIPLPASLAVDAPHVFVENGDLVSYAGKQEFSRQGDQLIATLPLGNGVAPQHLTGIFALGGGNGVRFVADPGMVPAGGTPIKSAASHLPSIWWALAGALLGGLILNVMPCVFPILSLKALALARAGGDERAARHDALAYTAGVVLASLALGGVMLGLRAVGEEVGWAFQLQEPGVVAGLFVLAVAITANFLGVFEIPGMAISGGGSSGGGSFATGLLAAFVATPCTGPFMAAALGAALLLPALEAMLLFAALGLGLAAPFLLLGFIPRLRGLLPRPGGWMVTFRRILAIPMGLTALALAWLSWRLGGPVFALLTLAIAAITVVMLALWWYPGQRTGKRTAGAMAALGAVILLSAFAIPGSIRPRGAEMGGVIAAQPFSEAALARARASGRPVFVWFTADWCLTCKVNERTSIERAATRDAFAKAGVIAMVGDWTRRDPEITRFLARQGAAGVPLYLWYPAGGGAARQLPQVLTPGLLVSLASQTARDTGGSTPPAAD